MSKTKPTKSVRLTDHSIPTSAQQRSHLIRLRPLCAAIVGIMPALAGADILPDPSAAQRPTMNQTANGTPLVNIVDPNQRGISHNKFQNFNVDQKGVVFNNSTQNGVSAIGGQAMKNPNLNHQARAIIGEVTGSGKTALNGAMEVFGGRADLIIANPNGIQVNGVSTVNTNSLTLSTGKVLGQPDGSVRLGVERGNVTIDGAGISTEGLTHFDIISRTAQINGEIQGAADLKVVAGQTEYDPETRTFVAKPGAQADQPIAIDGSQLGSMYGGRIELVATDKGAGVRHQGIILGERDIHVTADGDIVLGAVQSKQGNIGISGNNVSIAGTPTTGAIGLTGQGDIVIRALQSLGVNANLVSQNGTIHVDASTLVQHAADILALRGDAASVEVPSIRINVGDYRIEGELYAVGPAGERIGDAVIRLENGSYRVRDAAGNIIERASLASSARLAATSGNIEVKAQNFRNDGGVTMTSDGSLAFDVAELLVNNGMIAAAGDLAMRATRASNAGSVSADDISILSGDLTNSGQVTALGGLDVEAATLANTGRLGAGGDMNLKVSDSIDNAGMVLADGTLKADGTKTLVNRDGGWLQGNAVQLRNIETMTNRDAAVLVAQQGLDLDSIGVLTNDAAVIQGDTVHVRDSGALSNLDGARIVAAADLSVEGVDSLTNDASTIQGTHVTVAGVTTVVNANQAALRGAQDVTIEGAESLENDNSVVAADGSLQIRDVKTIQNDAGQIQTRGTMTLDRLEHLANRNGATLFAESSLAMSDVRNIANTDSTILANADLSIAGATRIDNRSTEAAPNGSKAMIGAGNSMSLDADDIENIGGLIQSDGSMRIAAGQIQNADGAMLMTGGALEIEADSIENLAHSVMRGEADVSIKANTVTNTNASDSDGDFTAQIGAGGALAIEAASVNNASGALLFSQGDMSITATDISNTDGAAIAAQDGKLALNGANRIVNTGGIVGSDIDLATKRLENQGVIEAGRNATVVVDGLSNKDGSIAAADVLDFRTKEGLVFDDDAGAYFAGNQLKMHTDGDAIVNTRFESLGSIDLHAEGDITNNGSIVSAKSVALSADNITNNRNSLIWGMSDVSLNAHDGAIVNERNGNILSQGTMSLEATEITNRAGTIRSDGTMQIDAHRLENLSAYAGDDMTYGPGTSEEIYREVRRGIASTYEFRLNITLPTFVSNIAVDKMAEISAGGDLRINQKGLYSSDAAGGRDLVHNEGGTISAGRDLLIKGDLVNASRNASVDLMGYLDNPLDKPIKLSNWWSPTLNFPTLTAFFDTIFMTYEPAIIFTQPDYDFMRYAERWGDSGEGVAAWANHFNDGQPIAMLKQMQGESINMVMSKIFGPTWKAASNSDLRARWAEVSGHEYAELKEQKFYFLPEEKASLYAGGNFVHTGGEFTNGIGGVQQQNKTISVKVGDQTIDAAVPPYDVVINLKKFEELAMGISTLPTLADMLDISGMFKVSTAWSDAQSSKDLPAGTTKVVPMYETQMRFIDQSEFFGTEYFFDQIGYNPARPANVIGDNYFITELIRRQLNEDIGTFFAVRDGVQGADMVKMLMGNAGDLLEPRSTAVVVGEDGTQTISEAETQRIQTLSTMEVGKPLTQAQMAALDTDIVWFVTESVNGADVLVPRVYLAPKTLAEIRSGEASGSAVVGAGGSVVVDATKATNASGSIVAGKDVFVRSEGDITNISAGMTGGITAGGDVTMVSTQGNVANNGAYIKGGGDVTLVADQGSVDITASVGYDNNGKHRIHEFDDAIVAGGSVGLHGDDVTLNSAYIAANGNVVINADEGSVQSNEMHQMDSHYDYSYVGGGTNFIQESHTDATAIGIGSSVQAGNALVIQADKDVTLEGGQFAGEAGLIKGGGTVDIKTTTNYGYAEDTRTVSQFGIGAGVNAMGYAANATANTMDGSDAYAGRGQRDNPNDEGQSNSASGKKAGRAPIADTASASFGYSKTTDKSTLQSETHTNAALSFGEGGLAMEGKTVDVGGANITTPGTLAITADDIKTTKYVDKQAVTSEHTELFVGIKAEGHSSIVDAANKYGELGAKAAQDGNSTDAGMTTIQVAGDVSNLIFNDLAGGSVSFGANHSKTQSSGTQSSENVNKIDAGNVAMNARNDISLNGVDMDVKDKLVLAAGGDVEMNAARSWTESSSSTDTFSAGVSVGASVSVAGAGAGASVDVSGSHERSGEASTRYNNTTVDARSVSITSGGDTTLAGANVVGDDVNLDIGGNLNVEAKQDAYRSDTSKGHWGVSAGVAVSNGAAFATGSVQAGGGSEYRDELTTSAQSGIVGKNTMNADVKGDLNIAGGHIASESGNGTLTVDGTIHAQSVTDHVEQDGGYGGGGGGVSRSGLGTINAYGETVDEIHKETRQNASITGVAVNAGGIKGDLNTDKDKQSETLRDETISGNQISFTVGIGDIGKMAGKTKTPDAGSPTWYDTPATSPDAAPRPTPRPDTPSQRVIVDDLPSPTPHPVPPVTTDNTPRGLPVPTDTMPAPSRAAIEDTLTPSSHPVPAATPQPKPTPAPAADDLPKPSRAQTDETPTKTPAKPADTPAPKPATPTDTPTPTLKPAAPDATPIPDSADSADGPKPAKKWPEVKMPTPFIGSSGTAQGLPGFVPPAKINTNTGKDTSAIGDRGSRLSGLIEPVQPKSAITTPAANTPKTPAGDMSKSEPADASKTPAADAAPAKPWVMPDLPGVVLSPGSSTAKPGFTPPAEMNINTGKDTSPIGDKGGSLKVPVAPEASTHSSNLQRDFSGAKGMSQQASATPSSVSYGPMLRQGSNA